jgi:hypothetical protein
MAPTEERPDLIVRSCRSTAISVTPLVRFHGYRLPVMHSGIRFSSWLW